MYQKENFPNKYLFIFTPGCLVFGGSTAIVSSLLIKLSYQSTDLLLFSVNYLKRLCVSLPVFMLSGTVFGHWRWTTRRKSTSI